VALPKPPPHEAEPPRALTKGLTSAVVVGTDTVQGAPCEHLAFRAPGLNWEIWIESGPRALPRRLEITYTEATNFPETGQRAGGGKETVHFHGGLCGKGKRADAWKERG
jgi:hypothetical protein